MAAAAAGGGYDQDDFVDNVDGFICSICSEVLREPRSCKAGHSFCKSCIEGIIFIFFWIQLNVS